MEIQNQVGRSLRGNLTRVRAVLDGSVSQGIDGVGQVADRVCKAFGFRDGRGRWQRASCCAALADLEAAGHVSLPRGRPSRGGVWRPRVLPRPVAPAAEVPGTVGEVRDLALVRVETDEQRRVWNTLMAHEHPRGAGGCPDPADGLTLSGSHHDTCLVNVVSVSVSKMMRCGSVGISRPRRRHGRRRSPARFPTGCGRPPGRPSDSARRRPGVHRPGTSTAPRGNKLRSPVMRRPFRQPAGPGEARRPSRPAFVSSTSRQVSQQLSGLRRRAGRL